MKKVLTILLLFMVILPMLDICYSEEQVKLVNPTGDVLFNKILKDTQSITVTFKEKPHHLIKVDGNEQEEIVNLLCKAVVIGYGDDNQSAQLNPAVKLQVDTANSLYLFYGNSEGKIYYDYLSLLDIKNDQQFMNIKRYYRINHNVLIQTDNVKWHAIISEIKKHKVYKDNPNNRF